MKTISLMLLLMCTGCTVIGPISHLSYEVKVYKYGVSVKSIWLSMRIGTQENERMKALSCWIIERSVGDETEYYNSREKKWHKDILEATGFTTIIKGDMVSKEHKLGAYYVVKHNFDGEDFK